MRIAFLGTPDFAVPTLTRLYEDGHELLVFTQPDRKKGRGGHVAMPAVKEKALELGLPVHQFEKISAPEGVEALREYDPDLMVTCAFGQILTQEILDIPHFGCINVHASLLPEYRGAAPIQQAIIDGKKFTGITTMLTDIGLDTGDILLSCGTEIGENETAGELFDRLAEMGAWVLHDTIDMLMDGSPMRIPQDDAVATKCRTIKKEMGKIDFSLPSQRIHDLVRGMNPAPSAYADICGQTVKIHRTLLHPDMQTDEKAGTCITADPKNGLFVATGDGVIEITELQFPNARRMTAKEALNSKKLLGEVFA